MVEKTEVSIQSLTEQNVIKVDYSDDDVTIIDNIMKFAEPNPMYVRMNVIAIVKKGKVQVNLGGRILTVGERQLLLCPPNTVLTDFMSSPDFEFKAVFLTNRIIQSFLREKINVWNDIMYIHKMHVVTMDERDVAFFYSFYETLRLVIESPKNDVPYYNEVVQSLLRCAILGLCGSLKLTMPAVDAELRKPQADRLFQRFLDLVSGDQTKYRSVESYASELCVSPKYLSVVCKKHSGKTANEWIRENTLEEIRYYLKQTDLPIKQIADKLGFANPSFFGKYVKEHFGMTPMRFRQS